MTPDRLQTFSQILTFVGVVLAAFGGFGSWYFAKQSSEADAAARAKYENSVATRIDALLQGNESLREQLKPFEDLAKTRYPTAPRDQALDALAQDIARVEQIAVAADKTVQSMTADATLRVTGNWSPMQPGGTLPWPSQRKTLRFPEQGW